MKPSVGRIVHYISYGTPGGEYPSVCRAAVITEIGPDQNTGYEGFVSLCVLNPTGQFFNTDVAYDNLMSPGTWHWPERID